MNLWLFLGNISTLKGLKPHCDKKLTFATSMFIGCGQYTLNAKLM